MADFKDIDISEYVVGNIDEAIKKGWIKVYYQPVIRSITCELCGAESLARWIDDEVGFLPPDKFIGALEDSRQIHKLDCYMVERVCKDIRDLMALGKPVVPVSVNFSRLDFEMLDMVSFVENVVAKYDIPRDMIHIEITESMIVSDEEMMSQIIREFRSIGYEVWMDDFGSGYSSLTLLKDFDFDLIKMDMRFLSSFNEKAKTILRAAITMAKDLGIRTLAEGVETQEHFDFLQSIGCARIQGYFYGKPEPLEDFIRHMREKNIPFEERQWKSFYDVASFAVRDTETPLEIVVDDGKEFKTLFMNPAYRKQVSFSNMATYEEIDRLTYDPSSPLLQKFRQFADIIEETGNKESFYLTVNGRYMKFEGRLLARYNGRFLVKGRIFDVTNASEQDESVKLETRLRELNMVFESVYLFNPDADTMVPLIGGFRYINVTGGNYAVSLREGLKVFIDEVVFPNQKNSFKSFMNYDTIKSRLEATGIGHMEGAFRFKQANGSYEWREVIVMMLTGMGQGEFLYCVKTLPEGVVTEKPVPIEEGYDGSYQRNFLTIWENLVWNSTVKFFWKDKNRRFKEVSQAFLDFYGIKSRDEIIGKTDEEMHWHVDEDYNNTEKAIVNNGFRVKDASGQCIVNGVLHNIMCNKMPLYDDGKIVGLIGYFIDGEEELDRVNGAKGPSRIDKITGLMNARSFLDAMIGYAIEFNENNKNYGIIMFENANYERIENTYGKETAEKLLYETGRKIIEITKQGSSVARTKNDIFAVITHVDDRKELHDLADIIAVNIETIRKVNGNNVTLKIKRAFMVRTEPDVTDETIFHMVLEKLEKMDV